MTIMYKPKIFIGLEILKEENRTKLK